MNDSCDKTNGWHLLASAALPETSLVQSDWTGLQLSSSSWVRTCSVRLKLPYLRWAAPVRGCPAGCATGTVQSPQRSLAAGAPPSPRLSPALWWCCGDKRSAVRITDTGRPETVKLKGPVCPKPSCRRFGFQPQFATSPLISGLSCTSTDISGKSESHKPTCVLSIQFHASRFYLSHSRTSNPVGPCEICLDPGLTHISPLSLQSVPWHRRAHRSLLALRRGSCLSGARPTLSRDRWSGSNSDCTQTQMLLKLGGGWVQDASWISTGCCYGLFFFYLYTVICHVIAGGRI